MKKEIYDLRREVREEREQNDKLLELGKDELVMIEEVEVKKVYGKVKDLKEKIDLANKVLHVN